MTKKAKSKSTRLGPARKAVGKTSVAVKRAYDEPAADDGLRILVDRVWPRGLKKAKLRADMWPKHLAPSTALRRWYQHNPERLPEFRRRYLDELKANGEAVAELRQALRGHQVTLLTATRELELSHANILREALIK